MQSLVFMCTGIYSGIYAKLLTYSFVLYPGSVPKHTRTSALTSHSNAKRKMNEFSISAAVPAELESLLTLHAVFL